MDLFEDFTAGTVIGGVQAGRLFREENSAYQYRSKTRKNHWNCFLCCLNVFASQHRFHRSSWQLTLTLLRQGQGLAWQSQFMKSFSAAR
eukprot:3268043-Amphidinium_carterae.1